MTICHNEETLEIAPEALEAHYGHGDTLGPCEPVAEEPVAEEPVAEEPVVAE